MGGFAGCFPMAYAARWGRWPNLIFTRSRQLMLILPAASDRQNDAGGGVLANDAVRQLDARTASAIRFIRRICTIPALAVEDLPEPLRKLISGGSSVPAGSQPVR